MTVTTEGIARLRAAQAEMRAHPEHVDMHQWFHDPMVPPYTEPVMGVVHISDAGLIPRTPMAALLARTECNTTACIAGTVVALAGEHVNPGDSIARAAAELLTGEHTIQQDVFDLFHAHHWPSDLERAYVATDMACETSEDWHQACAARVEVICDAINLWIERGGRFYGA